MRRLKTTIVPVIVGNLDMIKKGTDKHIKIFGNPNLYEIQNKMYFSELFIFLGAGLSMWLKKYHPKVVAKI